jgi:hypothetical protein
MATLTPDPARSAARSPRWFNRFDRSGRLSKGLRINGRRVLEAPTTFAEAFVADEPA